MMVAAVEHDSGMVLGQVEVDSKSNEIPAVRELSSSLDLAGRIVTVDAMHAQHETARCLLGRRADYVISAIKDNQETILEDLKAIDFSDAPWHETVDKGHGRIERRRCAAVDLSGAEWDGYAKGGGKVNIALYAKPEGSPVFGQFKQTDRAQFGCAEAQISQAECTFVRVFGIELRQQPGARAAWVKPLDHGLVVGPPSGTVGKQLRALFFGEQFHGMVLSNIDDRDAAAPRPSAPGRKPATGPEWRKAVG